MKKALSLCMCCLLLVSLLAACGKADTAATTEHNHNHGNNGTTLAPQNGDAAQEDQEQAHDHYHVNYKGLTGSALTLDDFLTLEGRAYDFEFEAGGVTYYAYNNVTFDGFSFDQVQISFLESTVRISCTKTDEANAEDILAKWQADMTALAGEPTTLAEHGETLRWADHTGSYITLTQLNEATVQLCYYLAGE